MQRINSPRPLGPQSLKWWDQKAGSGGELPTSTPRFSNPGVLPVGDTAPNNGCWFKVYPASSSTVLLSHRWLVQDGSSSRHTYLSLGTPGSIPFLRTPCWLPLCPTAVRLAVSRRCDVWQDPWVPWSRAPPLP